MGCSSCGQKYRGLQQRQRNSAMAKRLIPRSKRGIVNNPTPSSYPAKTSDISSDQPAVTVQPDIKEAVQGAEPAYAIDPTTGLALDVIKTGSCAENDLGDTSPQPVDLSTLDVQAETPKNDVG